MTPSSTERSGPALRVRTSFPVGAGATWRDYWRALEAAIFDGPNNRNNRFDVASRLDAAGGWSEGSVLIVRGLPLGVHLGLVTLHRRAEPVGGDQNDRRGNELGNRNRASAYS